MQNERVATPGKRIEPAADAGDARSTAERDTASGVVVNGLCRTAGQAVPVSHRLGTCYPLGVVPQEEA